MTGDWRDRRGKPGSPPPETSQVMRRDPAYRPVAQAGWQRPPLPTRPPAPPPRRAAPAAPPEKRPKRRWVRRVVVAVPALALVALVAFVGFCVWTDRALHRAPVLTDYDGRPAAARGTTWLLVGSDSRSDLSPEQQDALATGGDLGAGRTDTIMLIHIPGWGSDVPTTVVSIPRDSYLPIPENGSEKINAAFYLGGPQLLVQTVEQATGLRVDHYAEIGFSGFADVVDAVGGVTMCPPEPVSDPLAGIELSAGCQRLDGRSALGYVRTRATARADLDRIVNQREFLAALLHRFGSPAVWGNPLRWFALKSAVTGAVTVDAGAHVWDLARLGWALRGSTVTVTVPIADFTSNASGSVVLWNEDVSAQLFTALASDAPVPQDVLDSQP